MSEPTPLVQFPIPSVPTLIVLGLGFAILLFAAIGYEVNRRGQSARRRRANEWKTLDAILAEHNFTQANRATLENMIRAHAPAHPLQAATTRQSFGHCVETEFENLEQKLDVAGLEAAGLKLRDIRTELGLDYIPLGHQIHSTRELHDGQWMSIAPDTSAKPEWTRVMVENGNEAYFYVVMKDKVGNPPTTNIRANDTVRCRLWREEDARYIFKTSTVSYSEHPPTWQLRHTSTLERTQARAHFRVRHDQQTTIGILNARVDGDTDDVRKRPVVTRLRGRITSLSAGGCALVVMQGVSRQVLLRVSLELPNMPAIPLEAEIVGTMSISGGRYLVRTQFIEPPEETKDAIARYVLQKQQHQLAEQSPPE